MNRLRAYVRRYLWHYLLGFFFLLLTNTLALSIPRIFKVAVDSLASIKKAGELGLNLGPVDVSFLTNGALAAAALVFLMMIFRIASRITLFNVGRRIEAEVRNDMFANLLTLDPGFYESMTTGELMSRAVNDITNVRAMVGFSVLNLMNTFSQGVLVISQMVALSPTLTIYAVIPLPILIIAVSRISKGLFKRSIEVQEGLAGLSSFVQEDLTGLSTIQSYAREDGERERFAKSNAEYLAKNLDLSRIRSWVSGVMVAYGGIGSLVVLGLGGRAVIMGRLTVGDLLAFGMYLVMLTWPTMALGWLITVVQRGMASMKRVEEILDRKPAVTVADPAPVADLKGEVEYDRLAFSYPKPSQKEPQRKPFALGGITELIRQGTRLAIVGPTGSGKSTLVKFLPRLLEAQNGSIKLDGVDVRRIPLDVLRRHVGFVSQEPFLFSATIHENVAMGNRKSSDDDVRDSIRRAGLAPDLEEFPAGDKTIVGERGITLSGGQRQRMALARTLLGSPRILILDDVFSSVDAQTEKNILAELVDYMQGRTSIVITHRLSAIRNFDMILVIDNGRVVERGMHEELMAKAGLYRRLVERQAIEEELENL